VGEAVKAFPQVRRDVTDIIYSVAEYYGVSPSEVLAPGRALIAAEARLVAYALCRDLTRCSTVEIGAVFDRDPSTISAGVRSLCTRAKRDHQLARSLAVCRGRCLSTLEARALVPVPA